ncbi:MAG: TetR/AcrR family transcriptional regulator [Alphaproteobacteria bacterium]|nr:TetR/AcrR family transcriptional regulator [Alphaproteobacteria bacterium]
MSDTKQELIIAAAKLFAEKGYGKSSVADICKLAGANIAAVNYHFGNKEKLLFAVLEYCHQIADEKYPLIIKDDNNEINAQEKLEFFVTNRLHRVLSSGEGGYLYHVAIKSGRDEYREHFLNRYLVHEIRYVGDLVKEMIGKKLDSADLELCTFNVMSIFYLILTHPRVKKRMMDKHKVDGHELVELVAPRVIRYMIGGINAFTGGLSV